MPRITEERRAARREQILDAARACVLEHGLEAVSMEMIIARSGLSTGAVYRYFKGKDEILAAAVTAAASEIGAAAAPVLAGPDPGLPAQLVEQLLAAWVGYSRSGVGAAAGVDRMPVALHGWSYAQGDPELKATLRASLRGFRDRCVPIIRRWQADGLVAPGVAPEAVAQLILSICLGFVAQRSLTGDADVQAHAAALAALAPAGQAGVPGRDTTPVRYQSLNSPGRAGCHPPRPAATTFPSDRGDVCRPLVYVTYRIQHLDERDDPDRYRPHLWTR